MTADSPPPDDRRWAGLVAGAWDPEPLPPAEAVLADWRRERSRRRGRLPWLAAAAVLVFAAGLAGGRLTRGGSGPAADGSRYVLLLYGQGDDHAPEEQLVTEYRNWAERLGAAGVATSGERLSEAAWPLGGPPAEAEGWPLTGYFIVSAPSADSAVAIARGTPHLRHGGRVVVRHIEPS